MSKVSPAKPRAVRPRRALLVALAVAGTLVVGHADAAELNVVAWCDHQDPNTFEPFEKANDVKVNVKSYEGTGTLVSYIQQSTPGDWDIVSVDSVDIIKLAKAGLLEPLEEGAYPLDDIYPEIFMPESETLDGKRYGIPEKFGYNALAYNSKNVDADEIKDLNALLDPKYKDRIAIYDYYFTAIQTAALMNGIEPDEINAENMPKIAETLKKLKANAKLFGDIPTVQTALATGDVDIVFGGAEFLVAGMGDTKPELTWLLPEQGGLRWQSSIGIFEGSKQKDLAKKFVEWTLSPEGQARFAQSSCYWGMPGNKKAGPLISDEAKARLQWEEQPAYLERSYAYTATDPELDKLMVETWAELQQD
ncbi:extracellular solute-binding protein [Methyloligella sp. 2.7D]|uniref:ABC transporter substrate-binding protein n=1 Tax=unclassified Methyloligella TaxID=2625955 RepID=UPI00157DEF12|nr:extracellular solute-binding protein [Methyloligella sp. GL2]QKP77929.1 extracellular solute-binding protein [Methyloligella sp. GL2]